MRGASIRVVDPTSRALLGAVVVWGGFGARRITAVPYREQSPIRLHHTVDIFDDLSRLASAAICSDAKSVENVLPVEADDMLRDPDSHWLRTLAVSRQDNRIEYVIMKNDWRPVAWGALALRGATQQLRRACRYEFDALPPLDAHLGTFDTPGWHRANGLLFVGVAPSDFGDTLPRVFVEPLLAFVRIVERRLRLGIPVSKRAVGLSLPFVITRGNVCPTCQKPLKPMAVTCADCGWALSSSRTATRDEARYPDSLPDT